MDLKSFRELTSKLDEDTELVVDGITDYTINYNESVYIGISKTVVICHGIFHKKRLEIHLFKN